MISVSSEKPVVRAEVALPASKSESNRALIIQALSEVPIQLENLSQARDTQTMIRLLGSEGHVLDVIDAGTTMRFLTAYFSAIGRDQILTGTPRMCQRPIGLLVDSLRQLGAEIVYWNQEGFPPLHIVSNSKPLSNGHLTMAGNVSSQFITAILLIAPKIAGGLTLTLEGEILSRPYIEMTLSLMAHFGVKARWEGQTLIVPEVAYTGETYAIESDWSAASYWYSVAALADEADILLKGLRPSSWQGDSKIADMMVHFGVKTTFTEAGAHLTKTSIPVQNGILEIDFRDTPDLAQTMAVISAATNIPLQLSGLRSLRIKETDRIAAITHELSRYQVDFEMVEDGECYQVKGNFQPKIASIETYDDHRMAMAFAPLVLKTKEISFKDEGVVAKSYPSFWQDFEKAGFKVNYW